MSGSINRTPASTIEVAAELQPALEKMKKGRKPAKPVKKKPAKPVKKKAALTLLRLYRKHPDILNLEEWGERTVYANSDLEPPEPEEAVPATPDDGGATDGSGDGG